MKILSTILAVALLFIGTSAIQAQPDQKFETSFGLSRMLAYGGVTKELGLDDVQLSRLSGLWSQVEYKIEMKFRDYKNNFSPRLNEDERAELEEELRDGIKEVRKYEREKLEEVLSDSQINRLSQIKFQLIRRKSDNLAGLKEQLDITKDQLKEFKKLQKERAEEFGKLQKDAREEQYSRNELLEFRDLIKDKYEEKIREVLTPTQREKLKSLQGKKFEFQTGRPKAK